MIIKDPEAGFCICLIILLMVVTFSETNYCDQFQENVLYYVMFPCYKVPIANTVWCEGIILFVWGVIMFVKIEHWKEYQRPCM